MVAFQLLQGRQLTKPGSIQIRTGDALNSDNAGATEDNGDISIKAGSSDQAIGASVGIQAGHSTTLTGGQIILKSGAGQVGDSGGVLIATASAGPTGGSGSIAVDTGSAAQGSSGKISLRTGATAGKGTTGGIHIHRRTDIRGEWGLGYYLRRGQHNRRRRQCFRCFREAVRPARVGRS